LSRAGATVYAIEPNSAMRRTIERSPLIIPVDGAAEATSLADASVDVVSAFQAYHWFDPARVLAEAKRILRPGGRFAAVWNTRDRNDAFTGAYEQIVDRFDSSGGRHRSPGRNDGVVEDLRARGWRNVRSYREAHVQELEADGLIGFARSASYLPRDGAAYGAMAEEMRALYERWRKPVGFAWLTEAYVAERPLE
jgi:SAM-dependent methyltransferase